MIYDLIIIGGGSAGITAGIYAARQKMKTLLLTKSFGGQMVHKSVDIENYPGFDKISSFELIQRFENQLRSKDVEIETDRVLSVIKKEYFEISTESNKKYESKALIIATGSEPRRLNIKGEKEFLGKGVSYCATCDGPFFSNKRVVVIGGGEAGFETAMFLNKYALEIIILEQGSFSKASKEIQEKAFETGIKLIVNAEVKEIKGNDFVEEVLYNNEIIKTDGVFIQIGYVPDASFAKDLIDVNEKGEILINFETLETKTPGLFAAGDINAGKVKQIVTACGEGAQAAMYAYNYLIKEYGNN
ncbi:MAG: thioredoxin-disulfide reductase [Candidatus Microsyncoccus archaeolyticus]|nr:MAG: thioredoxin-disulfide reductase [Candidatus Parcubacteria bacterium]